MKFFKCGRVNVKPCWHEILRAHRAIHILQCKGKVKGYGRPHAAHPMYKSPEIHDYIDIFLSEVIDLRDVCPQCIQGHG